MSPGLIIGILLAVAIAGGVIFLIVRQSKKGSGATQTRFSVDPNNPTGGVVKPPTPPAPPPPAQP